MKLDELLKMTGGITKPVERNGRRGRNNTSTGHRGISMRNDKRVNGSLRYQVYSLTTPTIYIGSTDNIEKALKMQQGFTPAAAPVDCSNIKGVIWAHNGYRARFQTKRTIYQRQGFPTPEAALEWLTTEKAKHG